MSHQSNLKENILASRMEGSLKWLLQYKVPVLTGLGIVIGAVLIGSVFVIRRMEREELNWTRLSQAQSLIADKQYSTAEQLLGEVAQNNPGSPSSYFAVYNQGILALEQNKWDDAIRLFSDLFSRLNNQALKPLALANLGFAHFQKGDFSQAVATYEKFMSLYSDHFLAARTQLYLGESQQRSGNPETARKTLGQLIDLYPASPWAEKARKILDKQ